MFADVRQCKPVSMVLGVNLGVRKLKKMPWLKVLGNASQGVLCLVEWAYCSLWLAIGVSTEVRCTPPLRIGRMWGFVYP